MPMYEWEDWDTWMLWTVGGPGVAPGVGTDEAGASYVDDIEAILGDEWEVGERSFSPLDVEAMMAQEPRRD